MVDTKKLGFLGALLLVALAPAQQGTEQQPAPPAQAKQEFKELSDGYATAVREFSAKMRAEREAARKEGKPIPAVSMQGPVAEWMPKFKAGAEKYKGTDGAVPYLIWIAGQSREERDATMATLMHDHIKSPEIGGALRLITSEMSTLRRVSMVDGKRVTEEASPEEKAAVEKRVRDRLSQIAKENPSPDVQAQALLARANLVLEARDEVDASKKPAAIADVRKALAIAVDPKLKAQMEGILFEQDHLQVGMVAPEIQGNDLDGVGFKLSDYRGKVVLLDFWGYW
ncbi:MAG: hypothetical protein U1E73_13805 [Planctomycetota bacterium]